jgi:NAD(P)-dependent dehydrogenase (short-subunit alcohol dehydrogenase family)
MNPDVPWRLDGRVAAVVGAASGIGEAVAVALARVVCLDVDAGKAAAVVGFIQSTGQQAEAAAVDIREAAEVQTVFDAVRRRHGRFDIAVCTPSVNVRKPILAYADQEFEKVVSLNLRGNFNVLRAAGRLMTADGRGSIILFSSIRSVTVEPGQGVYAMTKAGIVQLVRTAAAEFGPHGVRVNAVAPGVVDTPLTAPIKANADWYGAYSAKTILKRWATPDEIAAPTAFLASDAASYMTGTVLFVDGGWTAVDGRFQPPGM